MSLRVWLLGSLLACAVAAPSLAAAPGTFDFVRGTPTTVSLFDNPDAGIKREGAGKGWPYQGIAVGAYTGFFPLFIAFSQGFELAVPIVPVVSAVMRVEGTAGLVINGYMFEIGARVQLPLSEIMSVYFDAALRLGAGRYDVDIFDDPEDVGQTVGYGPVTRVGFDIGGRQVRFFVNIAGAVFLFETEDERDIGLPYLGLELGIRVYLG